MGSHPGLCGEPSPPETSLQHGGRERKHPAPEEPECLTAPAPISPALPPPTPRSSHLSTGAGTHRIFTCCALSVQSQLLAHGLWASQMLAQAFERCGLTGPSQHPEEVGSGLVPGWR